MHLLIDGKYCPGTIVDFCLNAAGELGIESSLIRSREKDFYKESSDDYEEELRKMNSFEALQPLLNDMEAGDILVTDDIELATQAMHRVTAVLSPDGIVYTPESLELANLEEHLARIQGRSTSEAKPLIHRDPELDERFKELLFQYMGTIGTHN